MPVLVDTDSEEAKERRKWEMDLTQWGAPGRPRSRVARQSPFASDAPGVVAGGVMLYRAQRIPGGFPGAGKIATGCELPKRYGFASDDMFKYACDAAHEFAASCQLVVHSDEEYKRAKDQGWSDTSADAIEAFEREEHKVAELAANRAAGEVRMSDAARAEAAAVDADNFEHVPEIPEAPRARRGRPPNPKPVSES